MNLAQRGLIPTMIAAGITKLVPDEHGVSKRDDEGKPIVDANYKKGLHALRHFFASWCINRKEDGGRGLPAKVVQELLGRLRLRSLWRGLSPLLRICCLCF